MVFGIKGPKTLLAAAIANAMSEFFDVDPTQIESNLLKNAQIVLHDVKLRPQTTVLGTNQQTQKQLVAVTTGSVEKVSLTWAWNNLDSLVKDATFTISGLKFETQLSLQDRDETKLLEKPKPKRETSQKLEEIQKEGKLEAYIRNQVEQIIEALTLQVTDFEFALILPTKENDNGTSGDRITVGGKSVSLQSLGRNGGAGGGSAGDATPNNGDKPPLEQQLHIGSFSITVVQTTKSDGETAYPLLSPLSYTATARRLMGERFSSFGSGLEVIGESSKSAAGSSDGSDERGIVFHAGLVQLDVLKQAGSLFLESSPSSPKATTTMSSDSNISETPDEGTSKEESSSSAAPTTSNAEEHVPEDDNFESLKEEVMTSSRFQFPIPGISLVLPNDTKCKLEGFTFFFQADGTVMRLEGDNGAGILIDDYPLIRTTAQKNAGKNHVKSQWIVDFINSTFTLQSTRDEDKVVEVSYDDVDFSVLCAYIRCKPAIVSQVTEGMNQIIDSVNDFQMPLDDSPKDDQASPSPPSKWSVDIRQSIQMELDGEKDGEDQSDWVQMTLGPTFVTVPLLKDAIVKCGGIKLGPTSLGKVESHICKFIKTSDDNALRFSDTISADLDSMNTLSTIQALLSRFAPSADNSYAPTQATTKEVEEVASSPTELPIDVDIRRTRLQVADTAMSVDINSINSAGSNLSIGQVLVKSSEGLDVTVNDVNATLGSDMEVQIEQIDKVQIPGTFKLAEPVTDTRIIKFQNGAVGIRLNTLKGNLFKQDTNEGSKTPANQNPGVSKVSLPFPINVYAEEIALTDDDIFEKKVGDEDGKEVGKKKEKKSIQLKKFEIDLNPSKVKDAEEISVNMSVGFAKNNLVEVSSAKFQSRFNPNKLETINDLKLQFGSPVKVSAGYSAVDWNSMFSIKRLRLPKKESTDDPIKLPLAEISKAEIELVVDFKILAQNDCITFASFQGNEQTTTKDVLNFYVERIKKQAPGMITNTEVLGVNVLNTGMAQYGAYALHATSYGGAVVGLASVVGVDVVKGALKAGRTSRGGSTDEGYQAGDFLRGLGYAMSETTKSAAQKRREERKTGHEGDETLIDFAVGATAATGEYISENKAKLGGAGAAGVGMVVGTMVAGPLGGVVGGILSGATTNKAIDTFDKKYGKQSSSQETPEEEKEPESAAMDTANEVQSNSIKDEIFLQRPQGMLYKQRDVLYAQWRARWFVLHLERNALCYHILTTDEPPLVDTMNVFNRAKAETKDWEKESVGFEPVPREAIDLSGLRVELNESLTREDKNLYAFTLIPKDGGKAIHLAAPSHAERLVWFGMLAEVCGQTDDVSKLILSSK